MNRRTAAALAAALLIGVAPAARGQEPVLNPHTREACLHCHKDGVAGPERTRIFPSRDEPHAAVASSCRSCHKDGTQDFWLVILPRGTGAAAGAASPSEPLSAPLGAPPRPAAAPGASVAAPAPGPPPATAATVPV